MPQEPQPDPLFGTQKARILEIWNRLQRLQTDFTLPQELAFYYASRQWHAATTVLDLGTGNGYYLSKLATRFSRKIYHGIDQSPELIAIADREAARGHVTFSCGNLFDARGLYDFVVMRLVLQHLDDIQAVLDHVATLTKPGSAAVIIDSHDPLRLFHPDLPEFVEFFAAYTEHELKTGRDRGVASRVERATESSSTWRPGGTLRLLIPSTIPGNLNLFMQTYALLVDLVEQTGELQCDFPAIKSALRQWSELPDPYMQVGLDMILLDRI